MIHTDKRKFIKEEKKMAVTAADIDAIFDGASAVVDATQNIVGAVSSGVNQVQNAFDNSRRNTGQNNMNNGGGYPVYSGNYQPMNYGYGYSEQMYQQSPAYIGMMNNMPNQGFVPQYPQQQYCVTNVPTAPIINGYYGFSDPGYGAVGYGYPTSGYNMPNNGQGFKGGYGW